LGLEHEDALRAIDRALALNQNSTAVLTPAGWIRTYLGDGPAAIDFFKGAMRLNQLDPELGQMLTGLAYAYRRAGRNEEALETVPMALQEAPTWIPAHLLGTGTLVLLGRIEESRAAAKRMLALSPDMTLASRAKHMLFRDRAFRESILNALRLAGVPE
jgi:adenylate cyclase